MGKNGKPFAQVHNPDTAEYWKSLVVQAAAPFLPKTPIHGPVRLDIDFYLKRPGRLMRKKDPEERLWCTNKPDRDNLQKAVEDALTNQGWWTDDAYTVDGRVRKFYHPKSGRPGAVITITEL